MHKLNCVSENGLSSPEPISAVSLKEATFDRACAAAQPRQRLTLRANFLWTLAGNVVYAASQWGILVALAKLGTPEMVGEFALALAITAPIMIGTGLSLRGVQVTDSASQYSFGDYLSLRLITTALALLLITGVVGFSRYGWDLGFVILAVGTAKAFESVSDIFYGLLQRNERMDRIAISMMIKGLLSLAVVAGGVYSSNSLLPGVCGLVVIWALILVFFDVRNGMRVLSISGRSGLSAENLLVRTGRALQWRWKPRSLAALALLAAPVGIVMALISFNTNIPRYFIERRLGIRELGIFAAMVYPMVAGTTVVSALGQSASARLAQDYTKGDRHAFSLLIGKLLGIVMSLGCGGILLVWLAGRPILRLLYGVEYSNYAVVFLWLAVATAISYTGSILGYGMTAARYFRAQLPVFFVVTLVIAASCSILVPQYHLLGAAISITLAAICDVAGSTVVLSHALWNRNP